jgi:hypothetical protein
MNLKKRIDNKIYDLLEKEYDKLTNDREVKAENDALKEIPHRKPLTREQWEDIDRLWLSVSGKKNKGLYCAEWYEVYNATATDPSLTKYFMPNDFYYTYIDSFFTDRKQCWTLDNKEFYELLFPEVRHPHTLIRRSGTVITGSDYQLIDGRRAIELCKEAGEVIVKPSRQCWGGAMIKFWNQEQGVDALREILNGRMYYVVQEILSQHPVISAIYPHSINTIRVLSFIFEGQVHILSAVFRMGAGGSRFDNASAGGLFCGITADGVLKDKAYDKRRDVYDRHPQGSEFAGVKVPSFDLICEQVRMLAPRLATATRLVSWDYSVEPDGTPVLVEANLTLGGVNVHQVANGPVFGDMTEQVLRYVFKYNERLKG